MAGVAPQKAIGVPTSTTQHLQGLVTRKTATAEPKTIAQYFNHVADLVHANDELTALRTYNLKRRWKVTHEGYEAVLNRKKRSVVSASRPSVTGPAYLSRVSMTSPVTPVVAPSYISPSIASMARSAVKSPVRLTPAPVVAPPTLAAKPPTVMPSTTLATPSTTPMPLVVPSAVAAPPVVAPTIVPNPVSIPQPVVQPSTTAPRRSDFVVGTRVMIRHTPDLVACGARNLVGKTGRIVAVPQVYGQEVYSVYIDEHETMFQVPFNALVLISPPAPTTMPVSMQHQTTSGQVASSAASAAQSTAAAPTTAGVSSTHARPTPSVEDIKVEHSYQLHRLMQQQYREIQVLQQQYAECRLVNPAALPSIQKELSKLRLVHLSQVQTLKSKQALDLLGK
ncbi:hypothetical protein Poli38472_004202 [Pythium oligandrum]|uniref:Uncharacterized protein n=1 Tax=Pythium oligandrum TaxID=41045 RepID=A0A8K1FP12_PYTOL|nr:hypothetical protein Poli38472_004202 [Pythium oligandrum]|eukprot:TMW66437.1 hypothetical protein Poli38472_004202 [Pythium oligandrum]